MADFFSQNENLFFTLAAATAIVVFTVWSVCTTMQRLSKERTRRDMMAYVAEGSMTIDEVCRVMEAQDMEEMRRKLAEAVSEGTIKAADVASIVGPRTA